jgi:hypothetical protein
MSLIEIDKYPSPAKLRTFGLLLPVFFGAAGALARWRWGMPSLALAVWILGATTVVVYLAVPRVRRSIYVGWMVAVMPIGVCVSILVLAVTYFLILTPIGWVRRLFDDPLERQLDRQAVSYWLPTKPRADKRDYLRQF